VSAGISSHRPKLLLSNGDVVVVQGVNIDGSLCKEPPNLKYMPLCPWASSGVAPVAAPKRFAFGIVSRSRP
jgi:hypothetical protein